MREKGKKTARLAMLAALGAAFLYIAALLPSAKLAFTALSGIFVAAALMLYGYGWAFGVFAVTAVLAFLLLPTKPCALLYTGAFGYYPLAKAFFESRIKNNKLCYAAKLSLYSVVFIALWFAMDKLMLWPDGGVWLERWYILWPLGAIVFLVYDLCFNFLIKLYIEKISGYFK